MLYRTMPKNGDELSILGFGCMRLPMKDKAIDEERAIAQIRDAIDRGVNYVDTAWPYHNGASEPLVAKALKDGYREKVKLATKLPTWLVNSREDMEKYLNAQLERLETDHIDYYLMHSLNGPSWNRLMKLDILKFIDDIKADGRIVRAGFSYHGEPRDFNPIVDCYDWDFCQIQYNFLDRNYQAGLSGLKYAAAKNIGVVIMEPLRGGSLGKEVQPKAVQDVWDSADKKRTPVEWALRWIWNHPEVTLILSGMNEEAHIDENIRIASDAEADSMTPAELKIVDEAEKAYNSVMKVGCTACGYCLPCPVGVKIPVCFEWYNNLHAFGEVMGSRFKYAMTTGDVFSDDPKTGFASQCVACGECLDKCPQNIDIPEELKKAAADLEGEGFADIVKMGREFVRRKI
ncbi:MAG: aldo/keto reductase [Deferribacterales bacterium]